MEKRRLQQSINIDLSKTRKVSYSLVEEMNEGNMLGELLNRPPPQNPPYITPAEDILQINCKRPINAGIEKAVHDTKRWKDSGPDDILVDILHLLIGKIRD